MGEALPNLLNYTTPANIARWMPVPVREEAILEYLYQKNMYPGSVPVTEEETFLEFAIVREVLRTAMKGARRRFPAEAQVAHPGVLPWFEPIIASGSVLTQSPARGLALLALLDALEPTGISTLVLDQNNLVPALGAAAEINPVLAVQVMETDALLNLGTVIAPVGYARQGTVVLRVKLEQETGQEKIIDVRQGTLERIPIPMGRAVHLHLLPFHRMDIGMGGPGRGGRLKVVGGALGVIIDARGRPLLFAKKGTRQQEKMRKWLQTVF